MKNCSSFIPVIFFLLTIWTAISDSILHYSNCNTAVKYRNSKFAAALVVLSVSVCDLYALDSSMCVHTQIHTYAHTYTHANRRKCVQILHTHARTHSHICTHVHEVHKHIHTHTHYMQGIGLNAQGIANAILFCIFTKQIRQRLLASIVKMYRALCVLCKCKFAKIESSDELSFPSSVESEESTKFMSINAEHSNNRENFHYGTVQK